MAQVENGGFAQFVYNCNADPAVLDQVGRGRAPRHAALGADGRRHAAGVHGRRLLRRQSGARRARPAQRGLLRAGASGRPDRTQFSLAARASAAGGAVDCADAGRGRTPRRRPARSPCARRRSAGKRAALHEADPPPVRRPRPLLPARSRRRGTHARRRQPCAGGADRGADRVVGSSIRSCRGRCRPLQQRLLWERLQSRRAAPNRRTPVRAP
ncbi:hypothetical protein [Xanthomonas hyacinthi]